MAATGWTVITKNRFTRKLSTINLSNINGYQCSYVLQGEG